MEESEEKSLSNIYQRLSQMSILTSIYLPITNKTILVEGKYNIGLQTGFLSQNEEKLQH